MNKHTNLTIVKRPKKTHRDRGTEIGSVLVILLASINTETYTDESVNELKAAVEKGNTLLRGVPGQDAIEETYMEIVNAIQGLTKKDTQ